MKRKFYKAMMKFSYRMASRTKKRWDWWCRAYTECAERYCKEDSNGKTGDLSQR